MQARKANGSGGKKQAGKYQCVKNKQHINHGVACKMSRKLLRNKVTHSARSGRLFIRRHSGQAASIQGDSPPIWAQVGKSASIVSNIPSMP